MKLSGRAKLNSTGNSSTDSSSAKPLAFQAWLRRFFARTWVELAIAVLVVCSVCLTLSEFIAVTTDVSGADDPKYLRTVNDIITLIFMVELSLRYFAAPRKRAFLAEFWLDIIAVLPLFHIFPIARPLRLLRLVRVLRLFGTISRLSSRFPSILRRGAAEFIFVCGLLILTVIFGTGAMMMMERAGRKSPAAVAQENVKPDAIPDDETFTFENSFWFSVYSLFAGEPTPIAPRTLGGKIVAVFIMFMGLTIFAMFTGTFSAFMVERFRTEERTVEWDDFQDHIIICGWNAKAEIIVQEYQATAKTRSIPIAVVAQIEKPPTMGDELRENVNFLNDDFTRVAALEKAGVHRARTCIILADTSGGRSEQDADARTILAGLTVEKLNPKVYTCAELVNRSYATHLKMGHVNDYVVSGEYSAYMLAQSAMNRGLMGVFTQLLTYQHGNEFYRVALPAIWHGKSFNDLLALLKQKHDAILVAVCQSEGEMVVNPKEHTFGPGDEIVVIAESEIEL